MDVVIGIGLLLIVLVVFTVFTLRAPEGAKAMGGMADAAVATFLVEAVFLALFGEIFEIEWLTQIGVVAGQASGVAAAALVAVAMGVSPVYAMMIALPLYGQGILPGFLAGYLTAFVVRWLEDKLIEGLDMVAVLFIGPVMSYGITLLVSGPIDSLMGVIGEAINIAAESSPLLMGFVIGGLLTVISTAPISSMALTAMIGMTGQPMAIAGMAIFGSATCNYIIFERLNLGSRGDSIAMAIEPLTQVDLVSANPVPVYSINFVSGGLIGVLIAASGMVNNTPGTASVVPGIIGAYAWNDPLQVTIYAVISLIIGAIVGFIGTWIFRNYPVKTRADLLKEDKPADVEVQA